MKLTITTPFTGSFLSYADDGTTREELESLIKKVVAGASDGSLRHFTIDDALQGCARVGRVIFPADVVKQSVFTIEGE